MQTRWTDCLPPVEFRDRLGIGCKCADQISSIRGLQTGSCLTCCDENTTPVEGSGVLASLEWRLGP